MKKLLLLLLFPLMMFAQDSTLIGDVDCSGDVNSQDASLILQFVTNVIDELPCEVNMTGLTPEQLQEMIDMMEDQLNINYTGGVGGCDIQYPDGLGGEPITYDLSSSYTIPAGKNLYITNLYSVSGFFSIDGVNVHSSYSNYNEGPKTAMPFIAKEGQVLTHSANAGSFNGFLVDAFVEPITYDLSSSYTIPAGKNLYITNLYSQVGFFSIDGVNVHSSYSNYNQGPKTAMPFIAKEGQVLIHSTSAGSFNGYLVDEAYFADCSGGGGATTNSVAETGGSGFDFWFPDGYSSDIIYRKQQGYTVPEGKTLYITNISGSWYSDLTGGGNIASIDDSGGVHPNPVVIPSGTELNCGACETELNNFIGFLVDEGVEVVFFESSYTVPDNKVFCLFGHSVLGFPEISFDGEWSIGTYVDAGGPQFPGSGKGTMFKSGTTISGFVNGYLVDEDYFSSAGSGSNSVNNNSIEDVNTENCFFQLGSDINGELDNQMLGKDIAINSEGNRIAVGMAFADQNGPQSGGFKVFEFNENDWEQLGESIYGDFAGDESGYSIAINDDGTIIAIGEPKWDASADDADNELGRVRVFSFENDSWNLIDELNGIYLTENFGWSVSLNSTGNIIAIGAPYFEDYRGRVEVFMWNGNSYEELGNGPVISGDQLGDYCGWAVSLNANGNRLAINSQSASNGVVFEAGRVKIWEFNESTLDWIQIGQNIYGDNSGDQSGHHLDINNDGTIVAIGSRNAQDGGMVHLFKENNGTWIQMGQDILGDGSAGELSLSGDGYIISIGAYLNSNGGQLSGQVRFFQYNSGTMIGVNDSWIQIGQDIYGEIGDASGEFISLSDDGNRVAISSPENEKVRVYYIDESCIFEE